MPSICNTYYEGNRECNQVSNERNQNEFQLGAMWIKLLLCGEECIAKLLHTVVRGEILNI